MTAATIDGNAPVTFQRVISVEHPFISQALPLPDLTRPPAATEQARDAHAERMRRGGKTIIQVNHGYVSARQAQAPDNYYLRWAKPAMALDEIVPSDLARGIIPESVQALNRDLLKGNVAAARQRGFGCCVYLFEPYFCSETFFARHPDLRGPRVDFPKWSRQPLYSPCLACPETRAHYRQLARNLLREVPEIDELHVFTNDSGAGICYSEYLYSGANGPTHCRDVSPARHARFLLDALRDGAREINPETRVVQLFSLHPREWKELVTELGEGEFARVYGALSWRGGLEDFWGTMMYGRASEDLDRRAIRAFQRADFEARVQWLHRHGKEVYAALNLPGVGFEAWEIMRSYREMGVQHVIGGGTGEAWDLNTELFARFQQGAIETDANRAVLAVARDWVGEAAAPRLAEAWKLLDDAHRQRPMLPAGNEFDAMHDLAQGPLVPDFDQLTRAELAYYRTAWMDDLLTMRPFKGGTWRLVHFDDAEALWYLEAMRERVFPRLDRATAILLELEATVGRDEPAGQCLRAQRRQAVLFGCQQRRHYHWVLASGHGIRGSAIAPRQTMGEIIEAEIDNERRRLSAEAGFAACEDSPRIAVMRAHRNDALRAVDLSAFTPKRPGGRDAVVAFTDV